MKNGSLLVECIRKQQSQNLLSLTQILDIPITSSPHKTLKFCQGIVRDRDHDLPEMSEEDICSELKSKNFTNFKRFITAVPSYIYLGPYRIKVDMYVPNPTRCFKCQKFGHGNSSCRGTEKCVKCSAEGYFSFECD